ncbi:MAG: AI-2E family transporter, partial [Planctomycetota bacterium]
LLVIFLLSFYWCIEGERALRYLLLLMPAPRRPAVAEILGEVQTRLGQFVRGQLVLCVLVGFISWGAYWLIGLPYAGLLALIAGVLEAVPLIGPIVATVPATAVGLSLGWQHALWAVVANILIAHFESYILLPRIMNRSLGLHPVVTLVGIVVLVTLVGPVGGVLAIPSAAIAQLLFNRFVFRPPSLQVSLDENHRGPEADLLYEAQELKRDIRTHFGAWAASSGIAEARAVEERAEGWVDDFAAYVARPTVVEGTP